MRGGYKKCIYFLPLMVFQYDLMIMKSTGF